MKKLLALLLVTGLVFSVGCGKKKDTSKPKSTQPGKDTSKPKGPTAAPPPMDKKEVHLVAPEEAIAAEKDKEKDIPIAITKKGGFDADVKVNLKVKGPEGSKPTITESVTIEKGKAAGTAKFKADKPGDYTITATPEKGDADVAMEGEIKVTVK